MARSGPESIAAVVKAELRAGERLLAVFPAVTPAAEGGGLVPAELAPLVMVAERVWRRRRDRVAAQASIFPLAPRMLVGLTDRRLLIWSAHWRWRPGSYLGYVSRDRIIQSTAPTVGSGWRTVLIYLVNEPTVPIKVPGSMADGLASALTGYTGDNTGTRDLA